MKGKFLKETKFFKRNKFTRIMALILAMIMMSAPFFAHAGLKGDSKAEEAAAKRDYTITGITLTTDVAADKAKIVKRDNGEYVIGYDNGGLIMSGLPSETDTYYFESDYVSLKIDSNDVTNNIDFGTVEDRDNLVSGRTLSASFDGKIYYSFGTGAADIKELTAETEIIITKANMSQTVSFYLKPVVTDDVSGTYETAYQLVHQLRFKERDLGLLTLPVIKDNSGNLVNGDKYYNSVKIKNNSIPANGSAGRNHYIGDISCGYIDSDGNFTNLSTTEVSLIVTGTYTPCIRYSFSDSDIIKEIKGTPVKIDANVPDFSAYLIGKDASGKEVINREITNGSTEYISGGGYSWSIKIVADDGTDGSGIDTDTTEIKRADSASLPVQKILEGKKATFKFDIVNENMAYSYRIYDKAGNSNSGTVTIAVDNTVPVISNMHAEVGKNGAITGIENTENYYNMECNSLTLVANVTDDKALDTDKVYVYYKKTGDASYTKAKATDSGSNKYSYDASDFGAGAYSFYFEAWDKAGNKSVIDTKTFKVDRNPPKVGTVTYEYREKNEDGSWGAWKEWGNSGNKYVFNTALMDANKIQYSVVIPVTDDFSGVDGSMDKGNFYIFGPASADGLRQRGIFRKEQLENDPVAQVAFCDAAGNWTVDYGTADYEASEYKNYVLTKDEIEIAGSDIQILSGSLKIYETGKPENELDLSDFASGNIDVAINKSYTISVEAVSGYEIVAAELYAELSGYDDADPDSDTLTIDGVCGEKTFDITEGKNKSVVTFVVPGSEILDKKNEWLKNIKLKVTDNRPEDVITDDDPNFAETTIGKILYDISRPRLKSTNADKKWHKKFDSLTYNIVSEAYDETLPNVESGLSWLNYEITNSKGDMTREPIAGLSGASEYGNHIDDIPESLTPYGTIITFNAEDMAGNGIYDANSDNVVYVKVDKTAPSITQLTVNNQEGGNHPVPYGGQPVIKATASDNLTLDKAVIEVVYPDGTTRGATTNINKEANGSQGITETANYTIEAVNGQVLEGTYTVTTYAVDKAGRESGSRQTTFRIDNSKPVVTARVISGTASPKTIAPYYYKDNVAVELTYQDNNISSSDVLVSDNGNTLGGGVSWMPVEGTPGKYRAVIAVAAEGSHNITINATDISGNRADPKAIAFVVDKTSPEITAYVNGTTVYNDSMGNLMLTGTATVSMNVSDMTRDDEDNYVQIYKNVPNEPAPNPAYIRTSNTYMTFNDEADYVVNFYSIDRANNTSATKTVRFRVDRTAPELNISGGTGGTSARATTVTFTMREAFWWDADASLTIYRKAGDGAREELYKTVSFNPSAYSTSVSETLSQTGVYRFEFEARDNVGHRAQLSQTLTIDLNAPVVVLKGVNDYDMTDGAVDFSAEITDDFYSSKTVKISGTRTDMNGKVHRLDFGSFLQTVNPTKISQTFTESGVYDITLVTSDIAGNEHTENIHFTIDNAAPVIGDLSKYDGKIFKSFSWDEDLDELVSDLTVCDVQMFLNGSEYDGSSDIEDGSYVLLIVATDEMGQRTEKEVRFELDTKAPVFIVTGVEDKEVKNEDYIINISLQLDEDTLSSVTLNGTNISVRDNTATINVTEKGEYTLVLKAYDAAGNEAEETITFTYGEEKSLWWIWIIIACGIILLGMIIIIVVKKKKEDEQ